MSRLREESGFSLTELLVGIILAMILFGTATTTFVSFLKVSSKTEDQQRAQDAARSTIELLSGRLRNAMTIGASSAAIHSSSDGWNLVFVTAMPYATTPANNPRGLTYVRYCLESTPNQKNNRLFFQTAPYTTGSAAPPSTLSCPDVAWPTKQVISDHFYNRKAASSPPIFTYKYDSASPPNITHVTINPIVDWAPDRGPLPTELRSTVNLRNLNRVPTASLSCQGLASLHAVCDGSASTDPDGEQLTYSWKMNGSALATESTSRLDKFPLVSKQTYTFALTVTDAAGVTSTATRTVTIP
jgi:type II secretory pathway pseudopilin PulG